MTEDADDALADLRGPGRGAFRRRAATADTLVEITPMDPATSLPLLVRATVDGVSLLEWAPGNRDRLDAQVTATGALLFRGFATPSVEAFEAFVAALYPRLVVEHERSSPRSHVAGKVFTSTDHPSDQTIFVHNEMSYSHSWPMRIAFHCTQAPELGGETPICDTRRVLELIDAGVLERFEERHVMYVRNYSERFGLPWQISFQTSDRGEVERYCRAVGMTAEWTAGGGLRTRRVRPPVLRHPLTGERTWFNHAAFFHVSTLDPVLRDALEADLDPEDLPTNTFYGDGRSIEPEALDAVRASYRAATVSFPWRRGDVLLLDNMLTAHGRAPFEGRRAVVVAMAEPMSDGQDAG